jgi:hypothetical protein
MTCSGVRRLAEGQAALARDGVDSHQPDGEAEGQRRKAA